MSNLARMTIGLGLCFISLLIHAKPTSGTCTDYFKPPLLQEDGQISTTLAVRVLRHDAPIYSGESDDSVKENLAFGDSLEPLKLSQNGAQQRIQVMKPDATQPSGWMDSSDLLCAFSPLVNDKGIERKLFIKTPPSTETSSRNSPANSSMPTPVRVLVARIR